MWQEAGKGTDGIHRTSSATRCPEGSGTAIPRDPHAPALCGSSPEHLQGLEKQISQGPPPGTWRPGGSPEKLKPTGVSNLNPESAPTAQAQQNSRNVR